ncbi:MAG: NAD(P)/FAD-dependent oxidoreductase [Clostridia bacterium]|nr:NAD(P)/FAD-dependent oxidoreductase [Clostridia bacterium]
MKIIVIGAGLGGLVAAEILGRNGHEVSVLEKCEKENLTYDWHDDISRDIFTELKLPLPEAKHFFTKGCWTFVTPDEKTEVFVDLPEETRDYSMERRALAHLYVERAERYAKIQFGTEAEALLVEQGEVKGVIAGGEKLYADLVIDNSGVFSKLRESLPDSYKIEKNPAKNEVFFAYRAFHKRAEGSPDPQYTNKVYLKHIGEEGISWCVLDPSGTVNILIGRIGELPKEIFDNAYQKLKQSNPIISDEVVRGGGIHAIPVRHPALRLTGKGYALLGDSAFMTIPMMGSGMANSMIAASLLADAVIKAGNASPETLWRYQVAYYKKVGYTHTGADLLKRWMLSADARDLDFLLSKGVISQQDLKNGASGTDISLSFGVILNKIKCAFPRIGLLLNLKATIDKSKKAKKDALAIPETYDLHAIEQWEKKIKSYF